MNTLKELFDRDDVVELVDAELRKLMDEQPEFVYTFVDPNTSRPKISGCYYDRGPSDDPDKCSGCIFGQAFQRLGIPRENLDEFSVTNFTGDGTSISDFPKGPEYWGRVQTLQDAGAKWGYLKNYLPEVSA